MRTDAYTKAVLTVIAASLVWMCVRSAGQPVMAQSQPAVYSPAQPVVVVGWGRLNPAVPGGVEIDWADAQRRISQPVLTVRQDRDPASAFRVHIEPQGLLPISVEGVRRGAVWDPIRTQVEREPVQRTPGIGFPNPR